MSETQRALVLVGSGKRPHSNSESLAVYLLERLQERGLPTELHFIAEADVQGRLDALVQGIDRSGVFVVSFPLYVDS
ncbi:MAG TPA: NAD(P)H dehydrogenase, partial [Candidatus Hydrogenedentes bacterium]|nr:NAD(P)H dehydrogenase [Candidatus Hydrogenedentota bacterium]